MAACTFHNVRSTGPCSRAVRLPALGELLSVGKKTKSRFPHDSGESLFVFALFDTRQTILYTSTRITWRLCMDAELRVMRGVAIADLPPPSDPSCMSRSKPRARCDEKLFPLSPAHPPPPVGQLTTWFCSASAIEPLCWSSAAAAIVLSPARPVGRLTFAQSWRVFGTRKRGSCEKSKQKKKTSAKRRCRCTENIPFGREFKIRWGGEGGRSRTSRLIGVPLPLWRGELYSFGRVFWGWESLSPPPLPPSVLFCVKSTDPAGFWHTKWTLLVFSGHTTLLCIPYTIKVEGGGSASKGGETASGQEKRKKLTFVRMTRVLWMSS